jgi:hypothetical protein
MVEEKGIAFGVIAVSEDDLRALLRDCVWEDTKFVYGTASVQNE